MNNLRFIILTVFFICGCGVSVDQPEKISEEEQMYNQQQYKNAMNVARFNLNKNAKDPASIVTVWKVQVLQGSKSIDYVQQFYSQASERVIDFGDPLVPYLGKALQEDRHNTVRLFCMYCLSEFSDTLSSRYIAKVFDPTYTLGVKPSNVTLDFLWSEAAMILAGRKYTAAFGDIAALADNEDGEIRAKVAMALGLLGDMRAVPVLEKLSKDEYTMGNVRWVAEMADSSLARLKRGE